MRQNITRLRLRPQSLLGPTRSVTTTNIINLQLIIINLYLTSQTTPPQEYLLFSLFIYKLIFSKHALCIMVKNNFCTSAEVVLPSPWIFFRPRLRLGLKIRTRATKPPLSALCTKYTILPRGSVKVELEFVVRSNIKEGQRTDCWFWIKRRSHLYSSYSHKKNQDVNIKLAESQKRNGLDQHQNKKQCVI